MAVTMEMKLVPASAGRSLRIMVPFGVGKAPGLKEGCQAVWDGHGRQKVGDRCVVQDVGGVQEGIRKLTPAKKHLEKLQSEPGQGTGWADWMTVHDRVFHEEKRVRGQSSSGPKFVRAKVRPGQSSSGPKTAKSRRTP